jgi:hypothetical protein
MWAFLFLIIRSGSMTANMKSPYLLSPKMESLEDYVGSRSSKEIMENLKSMDNKEITELKNSLEMIFRLISTDKIYH